MALAGVCGIGIQKRNRYEQAHSRQESVLKTGAFKVSGWKLDMGRIAYMQFKALSKKYNFSMDTPYKDLPDHIKELILYGNSGEKLKMKWQSERFNAEYYSEYEGIVNNLLRRYTQTQSEGVKRDIERLMTSRPCEACGSKRLSKQALSVRINGRNISEVTEMPVIGFRYF